MTATKDATAVVARRRRGAALEDAILVAAYAELTEVGYRAFSVENVAARARTGKASIYRRWPSRQDLVLDALIAELPTLQACGFDPDDVLPDSTTTVEALHSVATLIARTMLSPAGHAIRAVKFEAVTDQKLAACVDERFQAPRREALLRLLRRGIERGEVRPDAATPVVADVLPAVLLHRLVLQEDPVPDNIEDILHDIIETVMIPLVEVR